MLIGLTAGWRMQVGSHGTPEFCREFPDFEYESDAGVAVYHLLYLGIGSQFTKVCGRRLKKLKAGAKDAPSILLFGSPERVKAIYSARLLHVVCRSAPSCSLVDPVDCTENLTIAEVQLFYEVFLPYLLHDIPSFGVPEELVVMWCGPFLSEYACIRTMLYILDHMKFLTPVGYGYP
jgi:hypothetical protein